MKQTAVEWLIDESMKLVLQYMQGTLNENILDDVIYEIGTKAKEMEKKQIIDAHGSKLISPKGLASQYWKNGEQYYNETFNKGQ
jgi:hypothetical protein